MSGRPTAEKMQQVAAQCRVVAKLAKNLSEINADYAKMFADEVPAMADLADLVGRRTADLMETLGDILNGMDAVDDEDEWMGEIFAEAHRLWPPKAAAE